MHSLRAEKLSKTIKKSVIVRDVSISLNTKEVVGLLGTFRRSRVSSRI